jgi:hypothetical protein
MRPVHGAILVSLLAAGCGGAWTRDERGAQDGALAADTGPRDTGVADTEPRDGGARKAAVGDAGAPEADALDEGPAPWPDGAVVAIPLSGCTQASYTAAVTIGSQSFALLLDTGSTTLGVAAEGCTDCGVTPLYSPGALAVDEHESVSSEYGSKGSDGTGWSGEVYADSVSLGLPTTETRLTFAAIDAQSHDFFQTLTCGTSVVPFEGILGMAPPVSAEPGTEGYFDSLLATRHVPDVFATELCDPGGTLWLGGYDPSHTTAPPQYVPYARSSPDEMVSAVFYAVNLERITVGGMSVPISSKGETNTILDTGNNSSDLPFDAYQTITDALLATPGFRAAFGAAAVGADPGARFFGKSGGGNCTTTKLGKAQLDATLPPLVLVFAGSPPVSVTAVATEAYLVPAGGSLWCPALQPFSKGPKNPIVAAVGSPLLRSSVVIFDREASRVGFAPHTPCP